MCTLIIYQFPFLDLLYSAFDAEVINKSRKDFEDFKTQLAGKMEETISKQTKEELKNFKDSLGDEVCHILKDEIKDIKDVLAKIEGAIRSDPQPIDEPHMRTALKCKR